MTLTTVDEIVDAEIIVSDADAEKFDTHFQQTLGSYAEIKRELIACVEYVRDSNVAERLGFPSRGDYVADRVTGLNVKWAVDDRRSLVELMTTSGMSTRHQADTLGLKSKSTVENDKNQLAKNGQLEGSYSVEGSDGKTYTYEAKPEPTASERDWPEVPEPSDNGENRHTDVINGTRNDLNLIGGNYIRYVKAVGQEVPKEDLPQRGNEYIIQYLRDNLAEITAATEAAINQLEGERK